MKSGTDILKELESISPLISEIERTNVYTVPTGYFEELTDMVLFAANEKNHNSVPAGYFDNLADTILSKIKEQEKNTSEELSDALQSIQTKNVYQVPNGYFNTISDAILNKLDTLTAAEEIRNISPMLYSIQNENTFKVPNGYFTSFAEDMLIKVKPEAAKVVVLQQRSVWFKYAVAAAFIGVISMGAFKFIKTRDTYIPINYSTMINMNVDGELAKISSEEIEKFLTKDGVDVEAAITFAQLQEKTITNETTTDKTESDEIDDLLNQLDETKTMN